MLTEIILISDADAVIENPGAIAAVMRKKKIQLNLFATADVANSPVPEIARLTGGQIISQPDPQMWTGAVRELVAAAMPTHLEDSQILLDFTGDLAALPERTLFHWNQTFMPPQATSLAKSDTYQNMAARWRVGAGQVAAAAFVPIATEIDALTALIQSPPRDPRFRIASSTASRLRVSLDAFTNSNYLNDQNITLELFDETAHHEIATIPQTAPGRYEIFLPSSPSPRVAIVRVNEKIVDRFAVAGHYPPEFDAIGNNHESMQILAQRTGGAVIAPSQTSPIIFARRSVSLVSFLASLGSFLIALGLFRWKFFAT